MRVVSRAAVLLLLTSLALTLASTARAQAPATPPNFKVAFLGDSATGTNFQNVLQLIENEGADMAIQAGDMGYGNESAAVATAWNADVTNVLGADYPYFFTTGNHDVTAWSTYQQLLANRLALIPGASCSGDLGVMSACTYQGLFFILSGIGSQPNTPDYAAHVGYISSQLTSNHSIWRICAWHKNQTALQLGDKTNEVGWLAYETCRQNRAIIATAHEHSYERTKTLSNTQTQTVDPAHTDGSTLYVKPGSTFVFVSGLGGNSIRNQDRCLPITPPYGCNGEWASVNTSDQGANYGALFIEFYVDGNPNKARGYFKEIDGDVRDTFTVYSEVPVGGAATLPGISIGSGHSVLPGVLVLAAVALAALLPFAYRARRAS
jgi:hypothetical protein